MATSCGFKSHLPHEDKDKRDSDYLSFLFIFLCYNSMCITFNRNNLETGDFLSMSKSKSKKSESLIYCRGIRVMDIASYVYALLVFLVYPLIYDDHYFNITITKYNFVAELTFIVS